MVLIEAAEAGIVEDSAQDSWTLLFREGDDSEGEKRHAYVDQSNESNIGLR
jgi:hypothetical protein